MRTIATIALLLAGVSSLAELPETYWSTDQANLILEKTLSIDIAPELESLSDAERAALRPLLEAGAIMHDLYLQQRHEDAIATRDELQALIASGEAAAAPLNALFYLFKGPIATTLDNERKAFVPAGAERPGKTLYPAAATRDMLDAFLEANPRARRAILGERTLVRVIDAESLASDLAKLDEFPAVDALNPGLRDRLSALDTSSAGFYAVPYALAYASELAAVRRYLHQAADILQEESPDFADYLVLRARDLLASDYEAGDAAWVSGDFDGLNLQIGSYETYDDALFGVKAFFAASILARDDAKSDALAAVVADLQSFEDALPYDHQKTVRKSIPVGVYNVVADFGQARGANTATILPNDAAHTRKYGRTILIRNNILTNPALFAASRTRFDAVVAEDFHAHLTLASGFDRTLWHEVGHYLGVSETAEGLPLGEALQEFSDLFEEMKSDLVSLYSARSLLEKGYYDEDAMRAHYASGVLRTLQASRPRPSQPYQNMQLMQFNYFIELGLLEPDLETGLLMINYDRFHDTVGALLDQVLHIQYAGDYAAAAEFVKRWNYWEDLLHGRLARQMQSAGGHRYRMLRYDILN